MASGATKVACWVAVDMSRAVDHVAFTTMKMRHTYGMPFRQRTEIIFLANILSNQYYPHDVND